MEKTYRIPENNINSFVKKIEKLNKKMYKMGKRSGINFEKIECSVGDLKSEKRDNGKVFVYRECTVRGKTVKINGWKLVAVADYMEAGNMLRSVPGAIVSDKELEKYRNSKCHCEHCGTDRHRKALYILRNEKHETKQVGRNCCREFLGFDPHHIAEYSTWELQLDEMEHEDSESGFGSAMGYSLAEFLAFTIQSIREDGWVSTRTEYGTPTARVVEMLLNRKADYIPPSLKDFATAEEVIEWGKNHIHTKSHISDYEHNLSVILEQGFVLYKFTGFAASIIPYVRREKGEQIKRHREKQSDFVGALGTRETFVLTYIREYGYETDYGYTHIYKFEDANGNIVVWRTSKGLDLNQGSSYQVTGKVVKHDIYRDVKQTSLNRCKIEEIK